MDMDKKQEEKKPDDKKSEDTHKADRHHDEIEKKVEDDKKMPERQKRKNGLKLALSMFVTLVIIIIIFLVVTGFGIYKWSWKNQLTDNVLNIIPYPAIVFDSHILSYKAYMSDLDTLNFYYSALEKSGELGVQPKPTDQYLSKSVLSRMAREYYLEKRAEDFAVTVSDSEIGDEFNAIVSQAGSIEEVQKTLTELYDWDEVQFKLKVLKPYLLRLKMQEYIASSDEINAEQKSTAEEVLKLAKAGERTFEDLVAEYSDDVASGPDGDLGFFGQGEMVPEFEEAAFALEVDEISGVVQTSFGFHIIKLLERVPESEESGEQLRAAHILITSNNIDDWLNDEIADKKVSVFISGYEWNAECGLVLEPSETCDSNDLYDFVAGNTATTGETL